MPDGTWNWFDLNFPWIGLGIAAILASLLFSTNLLRHNMTQSRWRDPVWLSWLGMFTYLIHNVEEYGLDILGQHHAFPDALCVNLGLGAYPACPVPPAFYLAVNLTMFWLVAPLAALLARRYPLAGLSVYSVIFINALVHIGPMLATQSYNPGAVSALLIFLPLSLWVAHACFGAGKLSYATLAWLVATGIIVHIILIGSVLLFTHGIINATTLILAQILNAGLVFIIPWAGIRHRQKA